MSDIYPEDEDIEVLAAMIEEANDVFSDPEPCWRCGNLDCWGTCDG